MSQRILSRMAGGLVLLFGLAAFAVGAAPAPPAKDDGGANKRVLYIVKHGSAKDLAAVLGEHFKGVADVQALPDPSNNCLLIGAAPDAFDDVVKVLAQIDRRPQTVSIEILIAQVATKKADGDKTAPAEEVDEKDFTGAMSDIEAKVMGLQKKGVFTDVKRIQLTAVEGQPQSMMLGETKPMVAGTNHTATGLVSRMITYRNTGTKADATVRVSPDKVVTLDLKLEDSHPYTPDDGIPIGTDENGKPILATEFAMSNLTSKLEVPSGKAQAAQGVKTVAKSGKAQTIVIVGATVIEPDAKPEK